MTLDTGIQRLLYGCSYLSRDFSLRKRLKTLWQRFAWSDMSVRHIEWECQGIRWYRLYAAGGICLSYYISRDRPNLQLGRYRFTYYDYRLYIVSTNFPFPPLTMHETHRLVDAASTLSTLLRTKGIPHAFYGNIVTAVLSKSAFSDVVMFSLSFGLPFIFSLMMQEIFCVVEMGQNQVHPFRRVRDAVSGNEDFAVTHSSWTTRLALT